MYSNINEPKERLSKDAVKVWIIDETIETMIILIVLGVLLFLDYHFAWKVWISWILKGLILLTVLGAVWDWINSLFLYKNWRYDVSEEFLQLKSGVLFEKHHLVPMTKI